MPRTTPAGSDDSAPGFSFPAIGRKKITAAFDGGRLTSDGGVLLLAQAERAMGLCRRLAACIADPRDPARVIHRLDDILRARVFAIACGYEDADDLDALRDDPGFRLALGKLPGSGAGLASQPTMSRWENAPTTRELARMMSAMIDIYCASYPAAPAAVTLDIDDDLPPSEWSKISVILDHEGVWKWVRGTSRKRSSASCGKLRSCWRRAGRQRMRVGGSRLPSNLLSLAQGVWRSEDRPGPADEGPGEGESQAQAGDL